MQLLTLAAAALLTSVFVQSHPGHDIKQEAENRGKLLENSKRDISHCATELQAHGLERRTIERRSAILRAEREKRGLPTDPSFIRAREIDPLIDARDVPKTLNTSHLSGVTYTPHDQLSTIFAGNKSCILVPEAIEGPFYVTGELIRSDVRETQKGVDLVVDIQVIDVSTCKPVPNVMIDFWHANSTGVYSGVVSPGNGDMSVASNINTTFHRGLQATNSEGVVQFTTLYPGHYIGRTQHIHVATHVNGTILPNNTFQGSTISHIGQIFFDQSLSNLVEATDPYKTNTQPVTTNMDDWILIGETTAGDPLVEYSLLGKNVSDGIFAWIAFGINVTNSGSIQAAASYGSDGGKANPNAMCGPPGGFPSGFSFGGPLPTGFPTGLPPGFPSAFPSGFPTGIPPGCASGSSTVPTTSSSVGIGSQAVSGEPPKKTSSRG